MRSLEIIRSPETQHFCFFLAHLLSVQEAVKPFKNCNLHAILNTSISFENNSDIAVSELVMKPMHIAPATLELYL